MTGPIGRFTGFASNVFNSVADSKDAFSNKLKFEASKRYVKIANQMLGNLQRTAEQSSNFNSPRASSSAPKRKGAQRTRTIAMRELKLSDWKNKPMPKPPGQKVSKRPPEVPPRLSPERQAEIRAKVEKRQAALRSVSSADGQQKTATNQKKVQPLTVGKAAGVGEAKALATTRLINVHQQLEECFNDSGKQTKKLKLSGGTLTTTNVGKSMRMQGARRKSTMRKGSQDALKYAVATIAIAKMSGVESIKIGKKQVSVKELEDKFLSLNQVKNRMKEDKNFAASLADVGIGTEPEVTLDKQREGEYKIPDRLTREEITHEILSGNKEIADLLTAIPTE